MYTTLLVRILRPVALVLACLTLPVQAAPRDIIVAQVAPFSGPQAVTGKAIRAGIKLYLDHVNAQGGVNGARIKLLTFDDAQKPEETVRLVREVSHNEHPIAFMGTVGTNNLEAVIKAGEFAEYNMAMVGAVSGASSVLASPHMFVVKASYHDEVDWLFRQLSNLTVTRIGVVYQDDGYGKDVITGAEAAAARHKVTLIARAGYERNTTKVENAVEAMLKAEPQAIFLGGTTAASVEFVRQYKQRGGLATLYGLSVIDTASVLSKLGPQVARGYAFGVVVPGDTQRDLPLVREYQRLKDAAPSPELGTRSMEGFIAAKVLVQALRSGANTPAAMRQALLAMRRVDVGGYTIDFSARGRSGSNYVDFAMYGRDGKVVQ